MRGSGGFSVALALMTAVFAGCVSPTLPDDPTNVDPIGMDWAARALPIGEKHDHSDLAQHVGLSTSNFEILGHDPLATEFHGGSSAGYLCGQAVDNGERRLAFAHSFSSEVGVVVADVTDAAAPRMLGELVLPNTHVYDVAASPDGRFAFLATSLVTPRAPTQVPTWAAESDAPVFRDACSGEVRRASNTDDTYYESGVVLVDAADPENPVVANYLYLPTRGVHSIFATEMDGRIVVLASVLNSAHMTSYFAFLTVEEGLTGPYLELQGVWDPPPKDQNTAITNSHMDGWIAKHPGDGTWYAYLADWNGGVAIVDVTNLNAPVEVGRWSDWRLEDNGQGFINDRGQYHGTLPMTELWDGKHYTLVGQEITARPSDTPSGVISVLDTTDAANPTRVAAWTLPVDVEWEDFLLFSTHYFRVIDRTMFVAQYHGGVWAVSLEDPLAPRTVGVFVPDIEQAAPEGGEAREGMFAPNVLDLEVLPGGDLVVWEDESGLYTLRFDAASPAPAVEEWAIKLEA